MSFSICNGNGDSVDSPSADVMRRFIDELDPADEEHGAAWVSDEFLVFGALGVHLYLGHLAYEVFKNSFFFPFALALLGLSLILFTV